MEKPVLQLETRSFFCFTAGNMNCMDMCANNADRWQRRRIFENFYLATFLMFWEQHPPNPFKPLVLFLLLQSPHDTSHYSRVLFCGLQGNDRIEKSWFLFIHIECKLIESETLICLICTSLYKMTLRQFTAKSIPSSCISAWFLGIYHVVLGAACVLCPCKLVSLADWFGKGCWRGMLKLMVCRIL